MPRKPILIGLLGLAVALTAYFFRADDFRQGFAAGPVATAGPAPSADAPAATDGSAPDAALPVWSEKDWAVFSGTVRDALAQRFDTLSMGETVARVGRTFVGTPYVPRTLEADGPEHLVIDFRELDCVTFVETAFTTARFVHAPDAAALLDDRPAAEARYDELLTELRYRGGHLAGYPSRLHYFSDWIADAEAKGLVRDVTETLGGVRDDEPVTFMTTHVDAYRQLTEDTANVTAVRAAESRLSAAGRWTIPQDRIADAAPRIRDGDIIAVTSTVPGLDVAHTGIALWMDGTLRLLNAPLVGDSVQISPETLAQRVKRITGQDGIIVARPTER